MLGGGVLKTRLSSLNQLTRLTAVYLCRPLRVKSWAIPPSDARLCCGCGAPPCCAHRDLVDVESRGEKQGHLLSLQKKEWGGDTEWLETTQACLCTSAPEAAPLVSEARALFSVLMAHPLHQRRIRASSARRATHRSAASSLRHAAVPSVQIVQKKTTIHVCSLGSCMRHVT